MPAKRIPSERWERKKAIERKAHRFIDPAVSELIFDKTYANIIRSINTAIHAHFERAISAGSFRANDFLKRGYAERIASDALTAFKLYLREVKPKYYKTLFKVVQEKIERERDSFNTRREELINRLMKRAKVDRKTAEQLFVANVAAFNSAYTKILEEIKRRKRSAFR